MGLYRVYSTMMESRMEKTRENELDNEAIIAG